MNLQNLIESIQKEVPGINIYFEVWPTHRRCGEEDYHEDEIRNFFIMQSAEIFFEKNEHKQQ